MHFAMVFVKSAGIFRMGGNHVCLGRIPGGRTDSMAFCMELMEKAGVIDTCGGSFRTAWRRICTFCACTAAG